MVYPRLQKGTLRLLISPTLSFRACGGDGGDGGDGGGMGGNVGSGGGGGMDGSGDVVT